MALDDLLYTVIKGKTNGRKASLLSDLEQDTNYIACEKEKPITGTESLVVYGFGSKYSGKYFTKREAECMALLLKGKTINSIATILKISPRTVEYYVKNMKYKLGCRTKFELVDLVYASNFMQHVDS